jgi:LmbE family N-acetylglucosaminyl deacetylase
MNVLDAAPELTRSQAAAASFAARYLGYSVLALGAHPDDIELGVGGTVALLSRTGVRVVTAIVSVPANYELRAAEAADAAAVLGAELRILVQGRCQRMEDMKSYQLVGLLDALVRELKPAAVLTHGPSDFHQDHVALYHAVLSSQRLARFDLYSYVPTMTRPVPVRFEPNAYVDITSTIEAKLQAIAAHRSQFHARALPFEFYRDMARLNGRMIGVDYAEALAINKIVFA